MTDHREYSPKRFAIASVTCPSCHSKVDREAKWCDCCGFTGAKSLEMFGENPPPLLSVLDVADFWTDKDQRKIEKTVKRFNKRFPQIRWRFCAVALGPEVNLPLFGFWMMNVCPLTPGETAEDREWTVFFLVDSNTGRASVTPGYCAEIWLSDEMWEKALLETADPIARGEGGKAVVGFLEACSKLFESAWKRSQKQLTPERR